jgi:steroid 5-alpha reductase family enzyme
MNPQKPTILRLMAHSLIALMLFQALIFVIASMVVVWLWSVKIKNAGIVDIAWAALFSIVALLYAAVGDGYSLRKIAIAVMVCIWSLRLASFLYRRVASHHPTEDARYAQLRQLWHPNSDIRFLYFFELQGIVLVLLTIPFALICMNMKREFSFIEVAAMSLWLLAVLGESLSDHQLSKFKKDPQNKGKTCNVGLWRYSRHPNYFCEWLIWLSYFVFALGSDWGWISIFCPLLMYHLLTKVTGIPMAEEQSLKSRGEEYRNYQQRTNAFFPWFPRIAKSTQGSKDT